MLGFKTGLFNHKVFMVPKRRSKVKVAYAVKNNIIGIDGSMKNL